MGDIDMDHDSRRNHNENHNTSHRVLRSMRSQDLNQSHNVDDASLDLSRFSFNESMNDRKGKTQQSQTIEETQNRNPNTQTQTQRRRKPKRSTKAKKWPKLRAKR